MNAFVKYDLDNGKCYLEIDTNLFNKDVVLKSAYQFLDKAYFFFKLNSSNNIELQLTLKDKSDNLEKILADFSDELLATYLRDKLEKENKEIREKIVSAAIANSLDPEHFVTIDTNNKQEQNQIDFDKDIDEILKEIENDPELKIDEEEIERILKEIEEETESEFESTDVSSEK